MFSLSVVLSFVSINFRFNIKKKLKSHNTKSVCSSFTASAGESVSALCIYIRIQSYLTFYIFHTINVPFSFRFIFGLSYHKLTYEVQKLLLDRLLRNRNMEVVKCPLLERSRTRIISIFVFQNSISYLNSHYLPLWSITTSDFWQTERIKVVISFMARQSNIALRVAPSCIQLQQPT